jgi:dihydroorotate dehydrogenase
VLLKIAPDLSLADLDDIVGVARARKIDGMIVGNTTIGRPSTLRDQETAKRPAGCPAVRSIRWRHGCWRRPMCGSKARSR